MRARRRIRIAAASGMLALLTGALLVPAAQAEAPTSSYIVMLEPASRSAAQARSAANAAADDAGVDPEHVYSFALDGFSAEMTPADAAVLAQDPVVAAVVPDGRVQIQDVCEKPIAAPCEPTGVLRIGGAGGGSDPDVSDMNVAVIDTGVDTTHDDLNVVGGVSCISSPTFDDGNGHGTHVAGAVAGTGTTGLTGVAPGARIWAVRVLNASGGGSWSDIVCGLDWVAGTRVDADPDNDIDVANMSLGGNGSDDGDCGQQNNDPVHEAVCEVTDQGVVLVVAAGNSARAMSKEKPASYDEVLSVTAIADYDGAFGALGGTKCDTGLGADDAAARFSDYAEKGDRMHTIAAPGVCILSSWGNGGYKTISGTSMASPHVAGAAVLCLASGDCPVDDPPGTMLKLRSDAAAYAAAHPAEGFKGDPANKIKGKYFGYAVSVSGY